MGDFLEFFVWLSMMGAETGYEYENSEVVVFGVHNPSPIHCYSI